MGDEAIPFLGGKVRVAISKSGTKMIFECADHTFCSVVMVGVRGELGSQHCICGIMFSWCGSTCCRGCGEWGLNYDGVGVCGRSSRL